MPRLLTVLSMTMLLLCGCSVSDYDAFETASIVKPRFRDNDPVDFGGKHPHRHDIHGIDVSKWNGDIDWQAARKSGVSFAFIKATEGKDRIDSAFERNWRGAAAAGLPHAPYHFYYFCSTPDEQADWFIRNVPKAAVRLPPVLDAEWNHASPTCKLRPDATIVRASLQRFMDRIEAHYGKRPIIYTTVDFHRDNLVGHFEDYHFWVRSTAAHPEDIYASRRWAFWQYTATGIVPGIEGNTDINVFSGTERHWQAWLASAGT
ncbi:glycoside hydrolase [Pseudorhizobium endolithicum]|uniref:Glycoside hydrolase n=1 Tax=Pseudorhizobium endolithicum TaxID=1191678 RepID=A0ABN7JFW2_9HYPH|nr:GH25 family lysozyme [Pseudorhizobium endolithicum]CAD6411715.1 glycoside hydrolase [Rhizobium sp. Q54]CAD7023740.1 glycoside hydrolase [Pseudorhizobium endolithicum]